MLSPTFSLLMVLELTVTVDTVLTQSHAIVSDRDGCKYKRRTERTTKATINFNGSAVPTND